MVFTPNEKRYEIYIEKHLKSILDDGLQFSSKVHQKNDIWYDKNACLIQDEFLDFIKESQPETFKKLRNKYGDSIKEKVLTRLNNEIEKKGLVKVLRKGFNDVYGGSIKTIFFQPSSALNVRYRSEKYQKNKFLLVRQLHYSPNNNNSIDLVIFINGIPILTIELKNQLTGQTILDSEKQYKFDRNPKGEPLLKFKRCICHFCVDNDVVQMTTKLNGEETVFLPFNKTFNNFYTESKGYKVDYLWKEILTPTSLLDILENFVLITNDIEIDWNEEENKISKNSREVLIFPRYHQLEVIRKLKQQISKDLHGTNYLVQHTTGSGKSYEIGWLSFMLINLFKNKGQDRIFDSVIVISDRKVLDKQLRDTVISLEQVPGVVQIIDKDSEQLKLSLEKGSNIIVTTIQKFSVVVNRIRELSGKNFAVIIDEVHSSQGGKGTKNLQKTLSINNQINEEGNDDFVNQEIISIKRDMEAHQKQNHITFIGFTGTPKPQTLEVFGTKTVEGSKEPFHVYEMRQSIGEGFTLDVLRSFTSIKRYFKLKNKVGDKRIPEKRGKKELVKWVDSNKETITRKSSIIIDHLLDITVKSINGRGKGMLVVRTIEDTLKFNNEINKQLEDRGLHNKIKTLIAFSGKINYLGEDLTERDINKKNGLNTEIIEGFKNPLYRLLIVCDKFQTGFNEPLLHTMFIDKPLQGVQCVQTLSRLNRKKKGKSSTFILDFVNKVETIQKSFQDFYQTTILSEETDPNSLYDLLDLIKNFNLFSDQVINEFTEIFVNKNRDDSKLQPVLNLVIDNWRNLTDEEKELSRMYIRNYCKLFSYLSLIHQFNNQELYKCYLFFEFLKKKFPVDIIQNVDVSDMVDLDSLDLEIKGKIDISLEEKNTIFDPKNLNNANLKEEEEYSFLSEIIEEMNEFYGKVPEGTEENSRKLIKNMVTDEKFQKVLLSENTISNKKDKLIEIYKEKNIENLDKNTKIFEIFNQEGMINRVINALINNPKIIEGFQ